MKVLVLAAASFERVKGAVRGLAARHPEARITVAVPEVERWRYEAAGFATWTLGEQRLHLDSPSVRQAMVQRRFDTHVIPLGFPRQPPFFLARWVRSMRGLPLTLEIGALPALHRWRLVWLALLAYGLCCWGPIGVALRAGRLVDGAALLGLQWLARWPRRCPRTSEGAPVCHVIDTLGTGGAQRQLVDYLRHTRLENLHLLVLFEYNDQFSDELRQAGLEAEILYDACRRHRLLHAWAWVAPSCTMLALLWRRLRQLRPAACCSWLFLTNVIAVPAARLAGVPRVISSVRNMSEWKTWPTHRRWWYRRADRWTAALSDAISANARAVASDYASWTGVDESRVEVVPNGIDASSLVARPHTDVRERCRAAAGEPVVLTMGRLAVEKNQAMLVRCCAAARELGCRFRLVLVGHGECEAELRELAAVFAVDDLVTFAGRTAEPQSYYRAAQLFVLSSRIEGMPNAVMEAQALGVAVVTTDCGGAAEVVVHGETGLVVGREDEAAMTDAIVALLVDPRRRAEMGRRGAARMRNEFTIEAMVGAIDRLTRG